MKLYVRGKPWIVTVDDAFLFLTSQNNLRFLKYNTRDNSIWAPLVEKGVAKIKGNYYQLNAGMMTNAISLLTGVPVFNMNFKRLKTLTVWEMLVKAYELKFPVMFGTAGIDDDNTNICGISENHSYTVLSSFPMYNEQGNLTHLMHMIRNPRAKTGYFDKWNSNDKYSWTPHYVQQIPLGVDPFTADQFGIFFIEHHRLVKCFDDVVVAHDRRYQGYVKRWYDVEGDDGAMKEIHLQLPEDLNDTFYL